MKDIYEYLRYTANLISQSHFHNKMILKSGSVLISKLIECGREDLYRLTNDLDIHCDKKEVWIEFYSNIEDISNIGHAYNVFSGIRNKPDVRYLLNYCLTFLEPIYLEYNQGELVWNTQQVKWFKL